MPVVDKDGTLTRLEICRSEDQWNKVCESVRRADPSGLGQFPEWWYQEVIQSGLGDKKAAEFRLRAPVNIPMSGIDAPPPRQRPPEGTRDLDWED
jgi:hypothetical protein